MTSIPCGIGLALGIALAACGGDDVGQGPDLPGLDPDLPPVTQGAWYRPGAAVTWQWQLDGTINTAYQVELYDVDLFEAPASVVADLQGRGAKVICYFSAGSGEVGRPDYDAIPAAALGTQLDGYPNERWLDVRDPAALAVMVARLDTAVARGCDGVEPDNVDGYTNDTGFPLTADHQLGFNRRLANAAHERGLAIALKNAGDQAGELVAYFDFELNEECHEYDECDQLTPFLDAGKPVLNVEYAPSAQAAAQLAAAVCPAAVGAGREQARVGGGPRAPECPRLPSRRQRIPCRGGRQPGRGRHPARLDDPASWGPVTDNGKRPSTRDPAFESLRDDPEFQELRRPKG